MSQSLVTKAIVATSAVVLAASCCVATAQSTANVTLTFYGYPDNDPPNSSRIHWPVIHSQAGGTGTYDDPTTVAVRKGSRWRAGTRMYLPYLSKYLIVEDSCAGCGTDHIDVWVGGAHGNDAAVIACEHSLTPPGSVPVEIDPPAGRPVNTGGLC